MKIVMWIILYFVIGIAMATIASMRFRIDRGYSIRNFDDLDDDEQGIMLATTFFWPMVLVLAAIFCILDGITKITNRKDDDPK